MAADRKIYQPERPLPSMETLLHKTSVQSNTQIAGQIMAVFSFLGGYIAIKPLYMYGGKEDALSDYMKMWHNLCHIVPSATRDHLLEVDDTAAIKDLSMCVEDDRRFLRDIDEVSMAAGYWITLLGFKALQITSHDDPRISAVFASYELRYETLWEQIDPNTGEFRMDRISTPKTMMLDEVCPICTAVFINPVVLDCCSHVFCKDCINEWVNGKSEGGTRQCPICRREILSTE